MTPSRLRGVRRVGVAVHAQAVDAREALERIGGELDLVARDPSMPMRCSACTAAASATAPTTFGVPASSRSGAGPRSTSSSDTNSIVPPPRCSGAPRSKVSRRPISAPVPNGAYILCADSAT